MRWPPCTVCFAVYLMQDTVHTQPDLVTRAFFFLSKPPTGMFLVGGINPTEHTQKLNTDSPLSSGRNQ